MLNELMRNLTKQTNEYSWKEKLNSLHAGYVFMLNFFEEFFQEHIRVFNGLNPDQGQHSDLGPISLQR